MPDDRLCPNCGHDKLRLISFRSTDIKNLVVQILELEARLLNIEVFLKENFEDYETMDLRGD